MDFLNLIRSIGELLFELLTWLIYYPRTLWLTLRRPLQMMAYVEHEEREDGAERYTDTLNPPLTLLVTIALVHAAELGMQMPQPISRTVVGQLIVGSDQNLILMRSLLFGLLPLMAALRVVRARGLPLERRHLRAPFFGQCYLAAVLAGVLGIATLVASLDEPWADWAAGVGALLVTLWYLVIQTRLFRHSLGLTTTRALLLALWAFGSAVLYVLAIVIVLTVGV